MAKKADRLRQRAKARDLFTLHGMQGNEVAQLIGVSEKTISKWRTADKWDEHRVAVSITKGQQLQRLYAQLNEMNSAIAARADGARFANAKEADAINKLASAINKLENEVGVAGTVDVFIRFNEWLRRRDLAQAQGVSELQDEYVKHLLSKA